MSINDELVRQQNIGVSFSAAIAANEIKRQALALEIAEFESRGGKINVIKSPEVKTIPIKEPMQDSFERGRANAHSKLSNKKSRKYIRLSHGKSPQVIVNGKYVGSYPNEDSAIAGRDQYLIDNNLPPVND